MQKFSKPYINEALTELGFTELTEVQNRVWQMFDQSKDMIIEAKTGSGKTHAFLLPIFANLAEDIQQVQALIIAPTRELSEQIYKFATAIAKHAKKPISIEKYVGGEDRNQTLARLEKGMPQIVIGTPGRLKDLVLQENLLKVYTAKYFVIDEADMTLDDNFIITVDNLAATVDESTKFMVFSATIPEKLRPFLNKYLTNPKMLQVHPDEIANLNISHYFVKTKEQDRLLYLNKVIKAINPYLAIVFCNTKTSANEVYEWMKVNQLNATLFHGELDYRKRRQLMKRINRLEFQYIVATDILARGIDIEGVSHIINYELPRDVEFYIHRSGRTGRIDFSGETISLYEFNDNSYLNKLEAKGVHCEYREIKQNQLVEATGRNQRAKRVYQGGEIERKAVSLVKKPKQVKPGYKKKFCKEVEEKKKQLRKKRRR